MTKRILLTGATGYVGSAIYEYLCNKRHEIFTAGRMKSDTIFFDLLVPNSINTAIIPKKVDLCIHTAALNEVLCNNNYIDAFTANITATRTLVESLVDLGVKKIIYISTMHVHGALAGTIDETINPIPSNDYGLTHFLAEETLKTYALQNKIDVNILRPANLFGIPRNFANFNRWNLAPFDFAMQAINTKKIVLKTDGESFRHFVSLDQLLISISMAMNGQLPLITNVSGSSWQIKDLANFISTEISQLSGYKIQVILGQAHQHEEKYEFCSKHFPTEVDIHHGNLRNFISSLFKLLKKSKYE